MPLLHHLHHHHHHSQSTDTSTMEYPTFANRSTLSDTDPFLSGSHTFAVGSDPFSSDPKTTHLFYSTGHRPTKDLPFLIVFSVFAFSTFALGIFAFLHKNPYSSPFSSTYDSHSGSCTTPVFVSHSSYSFTISSNASPDQSLLLKILTRTLAITLVLSAPLCLSFLLLLKHYAKQVVYASISFLIIVAIFVSVYFFVACDISSTCSESYPVRSRVVVLLVISLIIGIIVWSFVSNRSVTDFTVNIIRVAANALSQNLALFVVLPALNIGLFLYILPFIWFLVFAWLNGKSVPQENNGEYHCVWKLDSWVPAYYALSIFTIFWSVAAMVEAQVYVISDTIAQWYFLKGDPTLRRSLRSSLRNAFGPSFGTICLSGLLFFIVRLVRAVIENAKRDARGIVSCILRFIAVALVSAFDFLNKFTINFAAITGEGYIASAKMTYELLSRNLLSAVYVEAVSTRILGVIIFVISLVYGIMICVILKAFSNLGENTYFVAAMAWFLLVVVLSQFVHVLNNVIDTVYVCYAMDKDRGEVYKQDVHEVYVQLPISRKHSSLFPGTPLEV